MATPLSEPPAACTKSANGRQGGDVTTPASEHRFGFVAVCGRPNVGKSTLVNAMVGSPVAVATAHPQTTRERMLGVWTGEGFQAALVDTPGLHRPKSALNKFMVSQALAACRDVDVVLLLAEAPIIQGVPAEWSTGESAREGLDAIAKTGKPIVLAITKCDRIRDPRRLLPVIAAWAPLHEFAAVVPIAALHGDGIAELGRVLVEHLPAGPAHFDADSLTDRPMRWHAAEQVRAVLFEHLGDELPYSCAVVIGEFREAPDRDSIKAKIFVERTSQRGIVVGKGGQMIKAISMGARERIARLTGRPCDLRLEVDVAPDWTKDPDRLARLGYVEHDPTRGGGR
jgi:GTP-binding protein Era